MRPRTFFLSTNPVCLGLVGWQIQCVHDLLSVSPTHAYDIFMLCYASNKTNIVVVVGKERRIIIGPW